MTRALWCALALLVTLQPAAAAHAQDGEEPLGGLAPTLEVTALTGLLQPEDELRITATLRNRRTTPAEGLRLVATLYARVTGRVDLDRAMADPTDRTVWATTDAELDPLAEGGTRLARLVAPIDDLDLEDDEDRFGVYPLQVQLLEGDEAVASVTTTVVFTPRRVVEPLRVATMVTLDELPGRLPDASFAGRFPPLLAPGSRLDGLARELEGARTEVSLALSGLLLEQAADLADGFTTPDGTAVGPRSREARHAGAFLGRVRDVAEQAEVVALPYGPADLVALVRGGLRGEAVRLLTAGDEAVERHAEVRPSPGVLVPPDGLDPATLSEAQTSGTEVVVLGGEHLGRTGQPGDGTPSPVRTLVGGSGGPAVAIVPDPFVAEALTRAPQDGVAVAAQRLLAETAAAWFERPNAPQRRGLLIATPPDWAPGPGLLAALLEGLAAAPWIRDVPLSELDGGVLREPEPVRLAYPGASRTRELPPDYVAGLGEARAALGPLAAVLAGETQDSTSQADALAVAAAVHYRPGALAGEGQARIDAVLDSLANVAGSVEVLETPPITLTDDVGQVPVILVNHGAVPLTVDVRMQSIFYGFEPPLLEELELAPEEPRTVTFTARARSLGGLRNVTVSVEAPDGSRVLATGRLAVRTGAYSVAALTLTGGAAGFLLVWWARDILRTRKAKRGAPARHAA